MVEHLSSIVTSEYYKKIAVPLLRKAVDKGTKLINELRRELIIEGQELVFLCPEGVEKWTLTFRIKSGKIGSKKKFIFPEVRKVALRSLMPLKDITDTCVVRSNDGFMLYYNKLSENNLYMLEVEFDIEDPRLIDKLVYRKVQEDSPGEDKKIYWMQAQLRFVDVYERLFSNVMLEDLNFYVNVSTHEEIRTSIPSLFRRELEIIVRWLGETEREKKQRLTHAHLALLRRRKGGGARSKNILKVIQELQRLFTSSTFRAYLDVLKDFYYHDCIRGPEYFNAPFPIWPKFMTVVTRTNLSLEKPAAEGYLEFHRKKFKNDISKIFEEFGYKY